MLIGTATKSNKQKWPLHRCTNQTGSHTSHRRRELGSLHSGRARRHNAVVLRQMPQYPGYQLGHHLGNGPRRRDCILFTDGSLVNARQRIQGKVGDGKSYTSSQREVVQFDRRAVRTLSCPLSKETFVPNCRCHAGSLTSNES